MITSLARCSTCRIGAVKALYTAFGIPPTRKSANIARSVQLGRSRPNKNGISSHRPFSTYRMLHTQEPNDVRTSTEQDSADEDPLTLESSSEPAEPWYLKVRLPDEANLQPLQSSQKLPEVPTDAPPLVQPVLEHLSLVNGLDDLVFLDLRHINPPPALGANLVMIIGTARSEKHLHISADKLCQWLKREHNLSPYADGLLGRGELKVKLRRKAKRARIMSRVGVTEPGAVDDGIRTGWICVNIGDIPDHASRLGTTVPQIDYVGFGEDMSGAKLVIQMLTQEKREELDLEDLWGKIANKHTRKLHGDGAKPVLQSNHSQSHFTTSSPSGIPKSLSQGSSTYQQFSHVRPYSSTAAIAHKQDSHIENVKQHNQLGGQQASSNPPSMSSSNDTIQSDRNDIVQKAEAAYTSSSAILGEILLPLAALDHDQAQAKIDDPQSSVWTQIRKIQRSHHGVTDAGIHLLVLCKLHADSPYSWHMGISRYFDFMLSNYVGIPFAIFPHVLTALISRKSFIHESSISDENLSRLVYEIFRLLETMSLRGVHIDQATAFALEEKLTHLKHNSEQKMYKDLDLTQFRRLLSQMTAWQSLSDNRTRLKALQLYGSYHCWDIVWSIWREYAQRGERRSEDEYIAMFDCLAQRGHQEQTMIGLRNCLADMTSEEPRVHLTPRIATALMPCLQMVQPNVAEVCSRGDWYGEWAQYWQECQRVLASSTPGHG